MKIIESYFIPNQIESITFDKIEAEAETELIFTSNSLRIFWSET